MTLEQIHYFLMAAQTRNFSQVARQTFTTQPTVSRQISLLEAELGFPLFERKRKGMELTEPGDYLFRELKKSMDSIDAAIRTARQITTSYFGSLKVGSFAENSLETFFFPALMDIRQTCPSIQISIEKQDYYQLQRLLEEDELDIIFTYNFDPIDESVYKAYEISQVSGRIILSAAHPLLEEARKDFHALKNEHFYFMGDPHYYGQSVQELNLPEDHVHIVSSFDSALINVALGNGVAIFNDLMNGQYQSEMLGTVELEHRIDNGAKAIAIAKRTNQNPSLALLLNLLFPQ